MPDIASMQIRIGDIVSVRHYSGLSLFKSIVRNLNESSIVVRLTKEFAIMNFLEGDPAVLGFESDGKIYIIGCNVSAINTQDDTVQLTVDSIESEADKRRHERFPVSLYADIRLSNDRKKHLGVVKDISYYGMLIYSKMEFPIGSVIEADIYMEKIIIFLKCNIVRKSISGNYNAYGTGIMYQDANSMNFIKEYLKRLKEAQEESVRKLKGVG